MSILYQMRTFLILSAIMFSLAFFTIKVIALGWPFHIPEIDGGMEVTYQTIKKKDKVELDPV